MEAGSTYILLDVLIAGGAVYVIFVAAKMLKTGELTQNGLMSKNVDVKKCKDVEGYIRFMCPKQLLFGIIALISAAVGLVHDFTGALGTGIYMACIVVTVAYLIYYAMQSKKAMAMFW